MRYYAPWLCRWISADPAGDVDGLNLYRMVKNNPLRHVDVLGQMADEPPLPPNLDFEGMTDEQRRNVRRLLNAKHDLDNLANTNPATMLDDVKHWVQRVLATKAKTKLTSAGGALGGAVGGVIGGVMNETSDPEGGSVGGGATASAVGTAIGGIIGGIIGNLIARVILRAYNSTIMGRINKDIELSTASSQEHIEMPVINSAPEPLRELELELEAIRIREIIEGPDDSFHDATQDTEIAENTMNAITAAINSPALSSVLGERFTVVEWERTVGYHPPTDRTQPVIEPAEQPGYWRSVMSWFGRAPAVS